MKYRIFKVQTAMNMMMKVVTYLIKLNWTIQLKVQNNAQEQAATTSKMVSAVRTKKFEKQHSFLTTIKFNSKKVINKNRRQIASTKN